MKIGLIGLPNSGKTTIFNSLTKSEASVTTYANCKIKPNQAVVDVADDRVDYLSEMYKPQKTVYAKIELTDFVGLSKGSSKEDLFSKTSMELIKASDSLGLVVRNFQDDYGENPTPLRDVETIKDELLICDMIIVEHRLERIEQACKRGNKTNILEREERMLRKILEHLGDNRWISDLRLNYEQEKMIRGFKFITQKPLMIILNSGEIHFGENQEIIEEIEKKNRVIEFAGKFEMELSRLTNQEDVKLFMDDIGIQQSAQHRLTRLAYETLGYVSFFTVGSDEVRAWNIVNGSTAVKAAETIHTDLARGFIRAECYSCHDLMECGSEKSAREKGLSRLEGKKYVVQDGEVMNIRFHV